MKRSLERLVSPRSWLCHYLTLKFDVNGKEETKGLFYLYKSIRKKNWL